MTNELIKALGRFLTRDIVFILGGTSIILTFLYTIQSDTPPPFYRSFLSAIHEANDWTRIGIILWIVGIAWALGFATQEFFGLLHISSPHFPRTYGRPERFLFERLTYIKWRDEIPQPLPASRMQILGHVSDNQLDDLERIVTLKMVGTTIGPSGLVCAATLALRWWLYSQWPDFVLAIGVTIISSLLIPLGLIKKMQEAEWFYDFGNSPHPDKQ